MILHKVVGVFFRLSSLRAWTIRLYQQQRYDTNCHTETRTDMKCGMKFKTKLSSGAHYMTKFRLYFACFGRLVTEKGQTNTTHTARESSWRICSHVILVRVHFLFALLPHVMMNASFRQWLISHLLCENHPWKMCRWCTYIRRMNT